MSGYRRFVAYVYEYKKGKKDGNCGYVKVEVRDTRCRMDVRLQCEGLAPEIECKAYGFLRKDGLMNGILLGSCRTQENMVSCVLETDARNMGGAGISLDRIGGMIFVTEMGSFWGTEWDDQPIRPENFREMEAENVKRKQKAAENVKREMAEIPVQHQGEPEPENQSQNQKESESEKPVQNQIEPESEKPEPKQKTSEPEEQSPMLDEAEAENLNQEQDTDNLIADSPLPDTPHRDITKTDITATAVDLQEDATKEEPSSRPSKSPKQVQLPGEEFTPFEDEDFLWCRKIRPEDIPCISGKNCAFRQNRFLLYGYYNFGHLLLCKRADGKYLFGVPGGYDQQERFMANMFGFPYFKKSSFVQLPREKGGYWYRLIDAPDFH